MFKKIYLLLLLSISTFVLFSCNKNNKKEDEETYDVILNRYIDNLIDNTTSYIPSWNQESFKNRWNYIDGVFLKSIIDLYKKTNDEKYINFVTNYTDYYIDSNGNFRCPDPNSSSQTEFLTNELDSICESRILFDLYEYTNNIKYLRAINYTANVLSSMNTVSNGKNYWHKESYPNQVWLDGMYMYIPFLSRVLLLNNNQSGFDNIKAQYEFIKDKMYSPTKKLYYHGYDDSDEKIFWAQANGCSSSFWSRSMGWYVTSLSDLLEYIPENNSNREYFVNLYKETIDGILQYKDSETNMFYQVLDKPGESALVQYIKYLKPLKNTMYTENSNISNYLESSGSSLFAYSILKGCNLGILNDDYKQIGKDIFMGTYNHSFKDNKLNDICITAGLGPDTKTYRDGSFEYYLAEPVGSNDAKGVGPFIMAYLQL
ncbi:MAG: glycoside hydrolase family 88 protein [Acholeplasmatales bacterium]|nr:glycoside hydrolase family 88 protein [Acholeplasmatales bacterium]